MVDTQQRIYIFNELNSCGSQHVFFLFAVFKFPRFIYRFNHSEEGNRSEGDGDSPCSEVHKDMLEDLRRCRPEKILWFYIGVKLKKHNEIVTWCGRFICFQKWSGDSHGRWKISSW